MERSKKIISWVICLSVIFCICLVQPAAVYGKTSERTVRVAFPVMDGMSYFQPDGTPDGYNYAYLQKVSEYTGWKMEYIPYDGDDEDENIRKALDDLQSGKVDLLGPLLEDDSDEYDLIYPEQSYSTAYTTLCALEESNLREDNAASADPLKVGLWEKATIRNSEVIAFLNSENFDYRLYYFDTAEEQLEALKKGEVDVISNVSLYPIEGTRIIERFFPRPCYLASSSRNEDLVRELNEAISTIDQVQPSLQDALFDKYFRDTRYVFTLTAEQEEYLKSIDTLRVLCVDMNAPYVYLDEGKPAGMLVEVLKDFERETGLNVQYEFSENREETEKRLREKHFDMLLGVNLTSEYCAKIGFVRSKSIMDSDLAYLYKSGNEKHKTAAVERGLEELVNTTDFENVITCDNAVACIAAVESGIADYAVSDRSSLEYYIYDAYRPLSVSSISGNTQTVCVAISRDSDLKFIRLVNDYVYSLSDIQKTTFLESGNAHEYDPSLISYVRQYPLQALLFGIILTSMLLLGFFMMYHAKKMRRKNEELQAANQAKSEFLTRMSHDIRTPMNGIIGLLEIADRVADDPAAVRKYHQKIKSASEYLLSLINNVLDMGKLDSDKIVIAEESVNLREVVESCRDILESRAESEEIELSFPGLEQFDPPRVFTSELYLGQLIINIAGNAIKYNRTNGSVTLTAEVTAQTEKTVTCKFTVKDTGIGMSREFQEHMFDPFTQEHGENRSEWKGTGLGLSIVKRIIDKMGGEIRVESTENVGTIFTWILTFNIDQEYREKNPEIVKKKKVSLEGKKVLAAEDNRLNAEILVFLLEDMGADVTCVENGELAVNAFEKSEVGEYACILMDVMMPVMDGYAASRKIRQMDRPDAKTIPIIALTANAFPEDIKRSMDEGMNAHITKPLDIGKLKSTLVRLLCN